MGSWIFKSNRAGGPGGHGGDWRWVFASTAPTAWGGHATTASPAARRHLNQDVAAGDVVVAYQTDDRAVVGFCIVDRLTGGRDAKRLWLRPVHHLGEPLEVRTAKRADEVLASAPAFAPGSRAMLSPLAPEELLSLVRLALAPLELVSGRPVPIVYRVPVELRGWRRANAHAAPGEPKGR